MIRSGKRGLKEYRPTQTSDGFSFYSTREVTLKSGAESVFLGLRVDPGANQSTERGDREEHGDHGPPEADILEAGGPTAIRPREGTEGEAEVENSDSHADDSVHRFFRGFVVAHRAEKARLSQNLGTQTAS